MIVPLMSMGVSAGMEAEWTAMPQMKCKPRRLFIDRECAKYFSILDMKVGKNSHFANVGEVPGDIFAAELDRLEQRDLEKGLVDFKSLDLELPIVEPGMFLTLRVRNLSAGVMRISGAWEAANMDEYVGPWSMKRRPVSVSGNLAVCNDGTMWRLTTGNEWKFVKPVPDTPISKLM